MYMIFYTPPAIEVIPPYNVQFMPKILDNVNLIIMIRREVLMIEGFYNDQKNFIEFAPQEAKLTRKDLVEDELKEAETLSDLPLNEAWFQKALGDSPYSLQGLSIRKDGEHIRDLSI